MKASEKVFPFSSTSCIDNQLGGEMRQGTKKIMKARKKIRGSKRKEKQKLAERQGQLLGRLFSKERKK